MKRALSSVVVLASAHSRWPGAPAATSQPRRRRPALDRQACPASLPVAAGDAVRIQQLGFSIDDDSASRAQARTDAVRQAQAQAKQMADAAGVRLGRIHSITEVPANPPSPFYRDSAPAAAAPVPIEPGTQELTVMVEVVYGIDQ